MSWALAFFFPEVFFQIATWIITKQQSCWESGRNKKQNTNSKNIRWVQLTCTLENTRVFESRRGGRTIKHLALLLLFYFSTKRICDDKTRIAVCVCSCEFDFSKWRFLSSSGWPSSCWRGFSMSQDTLFDVKPEWSGCNASVPPRSCKFALRGVLGGTPSTFGRGNRSKTEDGFQGMIQIHLPEIDIQCL